MNYDCFLRAILQLRNTPDPDCGISPAEVVFGLPLRDAFSFVNRLKKFSNRYVWCTWRETWMAKKDALRLRAGRNNGALSKATRPLRPLSCGDSVFIQNQKEIIHVNGIRLGLWLKFQNTTKMLSRSRDPGA